MPNKEAITLSPEKLGLTQREIMYLFVFKMLTGAPNHPGALFAEMQERVPSDFLKSRTNFYAAMDEMLRFDWITFQVEGRKKVYSLTSSGKEKMEWYRNTYYIPLSSVREIANTLIMKISGSGRDPVSESARQHAKLFNRLINVRELVIYLFLEALHREKDQTAKDIYDIIRHEYGWICSEGYVYELAHELEGEPRKSKRKDEEIKDRRIPWIQGRWDGPRRNLYRYRLTDDGARMRFLSGETALFYIKNVHRYLHIIVELLGDEGLNKVEGIG